MKNLIRHLFFTVIVRFVVYVLVGIKIQNKHLLPKDGPAILVANHNSHLDAMVLMTILPVKLLKKTKPIAARDYFLCTRIMAWFSTYVVDIIPLLRCGARQPNTDSLTPVYDELEKGNIVIIFPEGSRGEPEKMGPFKSGIARLAAKYPDIPVVPIYLKGLGRVLPKNTSLLVPFFCEVTVGETMPVCNDKIEFMNELETSMHSLSTNLVIS